MAKGGVGVLEFKDLAWALRLDRKIDGDRLFTKARVQLSTFPAWPLYDQLRDPHRRLCDDGVRGLQPAGGENDD